MVEWIVRTSGSIAALQNESIQIEELLANFALIRLPEADVPKVKADERILEARLSTRMVFYGYEENLSVCAAKVNDGERDLTGEGVLLAVIDSGLDIYRDDFRNEDGSRVLYFYDLDKQIVLSNEQINQLLRQEKREVFDASYHGTAVASIAAGGGILPYANGVAPNCSLLVVRLKSEITTADVMRGIDFSVRMAQKMQMPLVINLSVGNSLGPHNGKSILEQYIDEVSLLGKMCICVGVGNEANTRGHMMIDTAISTRGQFFVGERELFLTIQIWKKIRQFATLTLVFPDGSAYEVEIKKGVWKIWEGNHIFWLYVRLPSPTMELEEVILYLGDGERELPSGVYELQFFEEKNEQIELYMESGSLRGRDTGFVQASPWNTMTIPSMARRCISVAASGLNDGTYAVFSGRGNEKNCSPMPTIAAPGINVTAASRDGYASVSGTSFSTPLVSGCCVLLMEWGIVRGNDLYLYGDRVKAYLCEMARVSEQYESWPNALLGNGQVCLQKSLELAYNTL